VAAQPVASRAVLDSIELVIHSNYKEGNYWNQIEGQERGDLCGVVGKFGKKTAL
jgi:hypothetical protein